MFPGQGMIKCVIVLGNSMGSAMGNNSMPHDTRENPYTGNMEREFLCPKQ